MNNKVLGGGACLLVLLFFLLWKLPVVSFAFGDDEYWLTDSAFTLKWIHSVEKEEWREKYERDGDKLILTESIFKTYGAGVPTDGEIIASDDGFVHMRIDREVPEMNLTVSENAQTAIEAGGREILLYEMTDDYEFVTVKVTRVPIWEYIGGKQL